MFRKIRQVWRDHKAMGIVRRGNGDVKLTFVVVGCSIGETPTTGYECDLYQGRAVHFDPDPSQAIIGALNKFRVRVVVEGITRDEPKPRHEEDADEGPGL